MQQSNAHTRKRNTILAAVILCIAILAIAVAMCITAMGPDPLLPTPGQEHGITYDDAAVEGGWDSLSAEAIVESLNKKVEDGYINISMNAAPVFADGQSAGNLMIVNESVNRYPQQVVITREDTGETIYTSNAIPVGSKIAADTLDVDLEAGTYDCTAMFHSLDPDTGAVLGSAGANITITIQH